MKLKKGDSVIIRAGKDKGKSGKVIAVDRKEGTVAVEGLNIRHRFQKARGNAAAQKVTFSGMMPASKVMLVDPDSGKPSRVGYKIGENGQKQRIAKRSGKGI